jgi:hypothetical protein
MAVPVTAVPLTMGVMTVSDRAITIVTIIVVLAVAVVALLAWWRRAGRRPVVDDRRHYDSAVLQFPGRCFRLCRDPVSGSASPCDQPVVGSGSFIDHRGNVLLVEACADHASALSDWHLDPNGVRGGSALPGRE